MEKRRDRTKDGIVNVVKDGFIAGVKKYQLLCFQLENHGLVYTGDSQNQFSN